MDGEPESCAAFAARTSSTSSSGRLIQPRRMPGASVFDAVPMWMTRQGSRPWIAPMALRS